MWCFARLFHYPGAELLQAISLYCLRHWHRFKAQELASMIWSLALLRACSADTWCALWTLNPTCTPQYSSAHTPALRGPPCSQLLPRPKLIRAVLTGAWLTDCASISAHVASE